MTKDASILQLIELLELGRRGWVQVDHWDSDLMAIGIARSDDPRRLVYVSTHNRADGQYYFECEEPVGEDGSEFRTSQSREDASFGELESALDAHLARRA